MTTKQTHQHAPSGFTLIEVLIALVIIAIALTALLMTTTASIQNTQRLNEKIRAHLVTTQALRQIQLNLIPVTQNQSITESFELFEKTWFWRATVTPTHLSTVEQIEVTTSRNKNGPFSEPHLGFRKAS